MSSIIRSTSSFVTVLAAAFTLAACAESSPIGVDAAAALSQGSGSSSGSTSGGTTTATKVEIALTRPADAVFAAAKGKAKFAVKGNERELQIEVENVPVGTVLTFSLGGTALGDATADAFGKARFYRNSTQGATVPMTVTGLAVAVTRGTDAVLTGSF